MHGKSKRISDQISAKVNLTGYKEKNLVKDWNRGPGRLWTLHNQAGELWTGQINGEKVENCLSSDNGNQQ